MCRIHLKHSGFQRHRGGTESWESWESWERGSSDKRKKEARDWKEDRDRKRGREREKCESHAAALIPACVHPCPSQTTRLAYRECVCVREKETDRKWARALNNKHTHTRWCVYASVQLCVCVSSPSRSESTWDEGHMRLNTSLVIKQSLVREVFPRTCLKQPMCCWRGEKERDRHHFWEQMEMGNSVCCWIRLDVKGLMGTIFTPHSSLKSSPPKFLLIHRKTSFMGLRWDSVSQTLLFVRKTCKFAKRRIALPSTPELSNTFAFFVQARCDKRCPLWKNSDDIFRGRSTLLPQSQISWSLSIVSTSQPRIPWDKILIVSVVTLTLSTYIRPNRQSWSRNSPL